MAEDTTWVQDWAARLKADAAKAAAKEAEAEKKKAEAYSDYSKKIAASYSPSKTNPLVIAALVVGGGALLYFALKK